MLLALYVLTITTLLLGAAYVAVLDGHASLAQRPRPEARLRGGSGRHRAVQLRPQPEPQLLGELPDAERHGRSSRQRLDRDLRRHADRREHGAERHDGVLDEQPDRRRWSRRRRSPAAARPAAGTFRIASTGTSNNVSRTIVAQYKRDSFLNFVYYTDYETLDPGRPAGRPDRLRPPLHRQPRPRQRLRRRDQLHHAPTRSTGRCTARTRWRSAAARPSGAPPRTRSRRPGFADESNCGGSAPYYGANMVGTYTTRRRR